MTSIHCPACGHAFTSTDSASTPDPSVVNWFRVDQSWMGATSTEEVFSNYLRATDGPPVSRDRFVADLAYLGIEEVLDEDTPMLVRR